MTKTAYIGIFALLLLMFLVNVLFDAYGDSETPPATTSAQAGEPSNRNPIRIGPDTRDVSQPLAGGQEIATGGEPAIAETEEGPALEPTVLVSTQEPIVPVEPVQATVAHATHKVESGDSCWVLAVNFYGDGRKWTRIRDANPEVVGPQGELQVGTTLKIPQQARPAAQVQAPAPPQRVARVAAVGAPGKIYKVKHGDSCWVLAKRFYGDATEWRQIRDANPGTVGGHGELRTGQEILIPTVD